jgi:hypothetical protein
MKTTTHVHPNAMWRSVAARLRSRLHSCSITLDSSLITIGNAYGTKPATVATFGNVRPTRRGVPPQ